MTLENCFMAWPNYMLPDASFATVSVSGGDWISQQPLDNLLNPRLSKPAISANVTNAATRFWVDLGELRNMKVISIPWIRGWTSTNVISGYLDLTVRARVFEEASESSELIYDSGLVEQHPVIYNRSELRSTHPSFMTGKITPEAAAKYGWKQPWWHWINEEVLGRHILFEIDAAASDLAHLQVPFLSVSSGFQPKINMLYGAKTGLVDLSRVSKNDAGIAYSKNGPRLRTWSFMLYMEEDEAFINLYEMMRELGIDIPFFFAFSPGETVHKERRAGFYRMRILGEMEFTEGSMTKVPVEYEEVID
ncbi:hypothetical protein [Nisaea sp.]|uniref:hypothetical protein n=1 Tax=Nisaea sp. TaxID=2024842 RepID=UPI003297A8A7